MRAKLSITLIALITLTGCSSREYSFLEQQALNANDYSMSNKEDLDIYKEAEDALDTQELTIETYKDEYKSGDYTIDNPYIVVNPYTHNTLSAYVAFDIDDKITYEYVVGKNETYPFTYTENDVQTGTIIIPIVGLYDNQTNNVELKVTDDSGKKKTVNLEITTEKSPSNYAEGSSNVEEMEKEAGLTMDEDQAASIGTALTEVNTDTVKTEILDDSVLDTFDGFILSEDYDIYDFDGNLRFSTDLGSGNNPLKLADGKYLTTDESGIMYEMDYMGRIYQTYVPPVSEVDGEYLTFHHDATVSADGKYIYSLAGFYKLAELEENGVENADKYVRESLIMKFNRKTGKLVDVFDYSDEFASSPQNSSTGADAMDPIHMNSIEYYEGADQLIISAKNQSTIFGVSPKTGEVLWTIKEPEGESDTMADYQLDVVNEDTMVYTSGNHAAFPMYTEKYMSSGDDLYLSVFDNRNCVEEDGTPAWSTIGEEVTCADSEYSSMVIYHINLADMTVETMEEIIPDKERWSYIRSSVYTNVEGYYQMHYADLMQDTTPITHSDLYVTDEAGDIKLKVSFDGMTNIYRARLINEDEIMMSLQTNLDSL